MLVFRSFHCFKDNLQVATFLTQGLHLIATGWLDGHRLPTAVIIYCFVPAERISPFLSLTYLSFALMLIPHFKPSQPN